MASGERDLKLQSAHMCMHLVIQSNRRVLGRHTGINKIILSSSAIFFCQRVYFLIILPKNVNYSLVTSTVQPRKPLDHFERQRLDLGKGEF